MHRDRVESFHGSDRKWSVRNPANELLRQPARVTLGRDDAGHGLVVPCDGRALAFAGEGDDFTKLLLGLRDGLRHGPMVI